MNNTDTIIEQLRLLGLNREEARLYLELLRGPSTHLKLAHATGINRTKVYRLADSLEKLSLVSKRTDDRGTFLEAADPSTLEIDIISQEEITKRKRLALNALLPALQPLKQGLDNGFVVHTYDGVDGFKQMLWHELSTQKEILFFGYGTIGNLIDDERWAEKHRLLNLQAGYKIREILNPGTKPENFTANQAFIGNFKKRQLPVSVLPLNQQIAIYNNTVAIYNWKDNQKVGVEVINQAYAETQRQIFEHYWQIAS